MEFFVVKSVPEARELFLDRVPPGPLARETVRAGEALGRPLAAPVVSPADVPSFDRATVDGYAVPAEDTFGASEGLPVYLEAAGEVPMGREPSAAVGPGQAMRVSTGGMLPPGADAVVMIEHVEAIGGEIGVTRPAAPGENVIRRAEDVRAGQALLEPGHLMRPQDLGALSGMGITQVQVAARPRVFIISTGDEVVSPESEPAPGQIRDMNSYALEAAVRACGGIPVMAGIIPDSYDALRVAVERGLKECDLVLVSGGSSVGTRDVTAQVISSFGPPGILVHGVAVKPGKPTILAAGSVDGPAKPPGDPRVKPPGGPRVNPPRDRRVIPIAGLPGHPVSALIIFDLFIRPALRKMSGLCPFPRWRPSVPARLSRNVASATGRNDFVRVRLSERDGEIWADPVLGKSGLLSTVVLADGILEIPPALEGISAGEMVQVKVFEG